MIEKTVRFHKATRYYELQLCKNLWGEWEIIRLFGRRNTKLGNMIVEPKKSRSEAIIRFHELFQYRILNRGYTLCFLDTKT